MTFAEQLRAVQQKSNSLLCVGLDTDIRKLPAGLPATSAGVLDFNRQIIEATHDLACAYKINLAFTETLGRDSWDTLYRTLEAIPPGVITIADGKRGDIGNSAAMYARAIIDDLHFTASTVHPYMGYDSIQPFDRPEGHGVFVLAVTSNPGARDFQYLKVRGKTLYEHVIARVKKWNTSGNFGLVVGATRPRDLKKVRSLVPAMPLLIPGIGAQGGDVRQVVQYGCDREGLSAVINASRSILYASSESDFPRAARLAAMTLRDEINAWREKLF